MTYAISGLKVVNPSMTRLRPAWRGGAMTSLGYLAPEAAIVHSRTSRATNTNFSRESITMPLFGRGVSGYHYGSQPVRLGLFTGTPASSYGSQPSYYGVSTGFIDTLPPWVMDAVETVHDITGKIVGDNPATASAPENTENKDIVVPVKEPGTMFGMDTKTTLLLAAGVIAVYLLAKKG